MNNNTNATRSISRIIRNFAIAASGTVLLTTMAPANAGDPEDASASESYEAAEVVEQISANEARRRAYRYLGELGYSNTSGIGAAKVRAVTREGDTWVARVAYSTTGRALSNQVVLYINANTAFVSEAQPSDGESRVAAK